jgi:hypothetical protein
MCTLYILPSQPHYDVISIVNYVANKFCSYFVATVPKTAKSAIFWAMDLSLKKQILHIYSYSGTEQTGKTRIIIF